MTEQPFRFPPDGASTRLLFRRRAFLQSLLTGAAAMAVAPVAAELDLLAPNTDGPSLLAPTLEDNPWPILSGVQSHLFPTEPDAPGATEINALGYLQSVLTRGDRDAEEDGKFLNAGATFLRKRIALDYAGRLFEELSEPERDAALLKMAGSADGSNWISMVMYYILEALLGDPAYGGNVEEVGWKWLHYTPGFPRPPHGKRYFELKPA